MPKLKRLSGMQVVDILTIHFASVVKSQRGSHIKLWRIQNNQKQVLVIPLHRTLAYVTLYAIYKQCSLYVTPAELEEFFCA